MSDFVGGLEDANEYLNRTTIDVPTGVVTAENGTLTAQTQSYSLKEIICMLLAGNGVKLPNLQICLKINLGRLIPEIPAGLADLKAALEEAEKALDDFIAHTNIDNALARLNAAVAEFAAIANMINFCGTPVVPRAIPNVLKDAMGSFTGAGKDILDTLGQIADSDIGGCIGTNGSFSPDLFTGGLLQKLGSQFSNLAGMPSAVKQDIINELNLFTTSMNNLMTFENNFSGTSTSGGSVFSPNTRVNTGVGMAMGDMSLSQSQQYASSLQALYNSLKGYEVDANGNNIFTYLLEPEMLAKLQNDGDPTVPLADRTPTYDYCGRQIGYTERTIQTVQSTSSGGPAEAVIQPGVTGLSESGTVVSNSPASTVNLGATSSAATSGSSSVDLSDYSTTAQILAADAVITSAFTSADTTATTDRALIRTELSAADTILQTNIDTNSALITTNTSNIATNTSNIATMQPYANANPTFTSVTTSNFTVNGTGAITLASGNDLSLTAADRVKITGLSPFRLATMTTTERNNISLAEEGDMVFNTTTKMFEGYNGTAWVQLVPSTFTSTP